MVELARTIRSGVVEARHHGAAIAVSSGGSVIACWGDADERLFYRSAIKPFQASVSQRLGADLAPEQMAVACSSHSGHPIQIELVRDLLAARGLGERDLGCPPALPLAAEARAALAAAGDARPRRIYHNCSGKHSAFLRACAASDHPTRSYLDRDHPLQQEVLALTAEVTNETVEPVGVDGCGAPAPSGTLRGLATAYATLTSEPSLADAATAMSRYPALVAGNTRDDGRLGSWWGGPVKRGAMGIIAAGRAGVGIAVKSREGSGQVALVGLMAVIASLGLLSDAASTALADAASPPVFGGGERVGMLLPVLGP